MTRLKPVLSLFDAVNVALGSIIGAGIFVIIGAAAGLAGPAVFLSVIVAAIVAILTGLTSAELSKKFPTSGGAYIFAKKALSKSVGFVVGWVWLFSNVVVGATVAVGFAYYLNFFIPSIPTNIGAALAVGLATLFHLMGTKESSRVNNILVVIKIAILLFFFVSAIFFFQQANFEPLLPFGIEGVLAGAATIFFAYSGFARVAVIADEIKNPSKNVPKATILSIIVSTAIYVLVAVAAVGIAGYEMLARSGSPLADAINMEGLGFGADLVGAGALVATGTVILASILGVSRLAYTMANNRELPKFITRLDKKQVPKNSIIVSGIGMIILALFADLPHIAYISSFSLLLYYAALNLSGLKILKGKTRYAAFLGLISCLVLMLSLPALSWIVGLVVVLLGIVYYKFFVK
ncbi:Amino acid permease [Candidatus Bilamarchaeum dharawalense]|uniref:Amino acid permease n=1 Tax=Candidatus Bilamarchaeum dharawalense TaxID=2885759 RepID=A0A5E4LNN2_9ARCH|nr:Amino acid permease [Candidatus Bilamarchaeum dharawalense]